MVDVRGEVLRTPHCTAPAAVKANKNQKWFPLRAMKTFIRQKKTHYHSLIICLLFSWTWIQEPIHWQCIKLHLSDYLCYDKSVNKSEKSNISETAVIYCLNDSLCLVTNTHLKRFGFSTLSPGSSRCFCIENHVWSIIKARFHGNPSTLRTWVRYSFECEVITKLNRQKDNNKQTNKHENKEEGKSQNETRRSYKNTETKTHTRTNALEWASLLCKIIFLFLLSRVLIKMKQSCMQVAFIRITANNSFVSLSLNFPRILIKKLLQKQPLLIWSLPTEELCWGTFFRLISALSGLISSFCWCWK